MFDLINIVLKTIFLNIFLLPLEVITIKIIENFHVKLHLYEHFNI